MATSLEGMSAEEIASLATLAKAQLDNPKTRQAFLTNSKITDPSASIPEVDIPLQVNSLLKKGMDRLEALERKNQEDEARRTILERRSSVMSKHGLNQKQMDEVEKLMLDKQIASHETAAEFYLSQQQSAAPTPSTFSPNTMPKIDLKAAGVPNMAQWARGEAGRVIDEFRGRVKVGS